MNRCQAVPYEGAEPYLFISYAHKNSAAVLPIIERLAADGYRLWYDEGIDPGSEWPETIAGHLNAAHAVIAFVSNEFLRSANCRREITFSQNKKKPLLAVYLERTELSPGMELQLSVAQAIFRYAYGTEDPFFKKLYETQFLSPCLIPRPEKPAAPEVTGKTGEPIRTAEPVGTRTEEDPVGGTVYRNVKNESKRKKKKAILLSVLGAIVLLCAFFAVRGAVLSRPVSVRIDTERSTTDFNLGDEIRTGDVYLIAELKNGKEEVVYRDYTFSPETLDTVGTQKVTVTYRGKSAEYEVTVSEWKAVSVTIRNRESLKKEYYTGDGIGNPYLWLDVRYENGQERSLWGGYTLSPTVFDRAGTQTVTVSIAGAEATYEVFVSDPGLTGLKVSTPPAVTRFYPGDPITAEGLVLTAALENYENLTVTEGYTVLTQTAGDVGQQTVTVSYGGVTCDYTVTVIPSPLSSLTLVSMPEKTSYRVGETFDPTGLVLDAVSAESGKTYAVTSGFTVSPTAFADAFAGAFAGAGKTEVTVRYEGKTVTLTVEVTD